MAEGRSSPTQPSAFEQALIGVGKQNDFDNFTFTPPKPATPGGRFGRFSRRTKYQAALSSSRDRLSNFGSNTSLSSFGSSQNLMDTAKMMNMQEDARSRRISSEVMKHRLYESVITSPRRRRFSMRSDYQGSSNNYMETQSFQDHARYVQSLPVTPAHSQNVSPEHSPTSHKRFMFGYFSRGTTPTDMETKCIANEITEEGSCQGLASIFNPHPRYIPGARWTQHNQENQEPSPMELAVPDPLEQYQQNQDGMCFGDDRQSNNFTRSSYT